MNLQDKSKLLVLASTIMFGSYGVWSKLIGDNLGSFYQGWTRAIVIVLIILPILWKRKEIIPIVKSDWKWLIVFLVFTSATQAPLFYAYNNMDIATASLIFFVTMFITMYVVGFVFFQEQFTKVKIISFILAILGLFTVFSVSLEKFTLFAALMAVINGIASGGEVSFSKKLTGNYSALYLSLLSWLIIIPTNAFFSFILGEKLVLPSFDLFWLWLILYSFAGLLGFWLVMEGLKSVEASIGGLIGLLEIVFSILFGIIIFGESLTIKTMAGGLIILFAAALPHIITLAQQKTKNVTNTKIP